MWARNKNTTEERCGVCPDPQICPVIYAENMDILLPHVFAPGKKEREERNKAHFRPPHIRSKFLTLSPAAVISDMHTAQHTQQNTVSPHNSAEEHPMAPNRVDGI